MNRRADLTWRGGAQGLRLAWSKVDSGGEDPKGREGLIVVLAD
jgi:hypothetical protein